MVCKLPIIQKRKGRLRAAPQGNELHYRISIAEWALPMIPNDQFTILMK